MKTIVIAAMLLGFAAPAALPQAAPVEPGDEAAYTFKEPVANGPGVRSLEDFRGKPVLVEFWGHR